MQRLAATDLRIFFSSLYPSKFLAAWCDYNIRNQSGGTILPLTFESYGDVSWYFLTEAWTCHSQHVFKIYCNHCNILSEWWMHSSIFSYSSHDDITEYCQRLTSTELFIFTEGKVKCVEFIANVEFLSNRTESVTMRPGHLLGCITFLLMNWINWSHMNIHAHWNL